MRTHSICAAALMVITLTFASPLVAAEELRVGVYDNRPKIFGDPDGEPAGLFVDLLEYVAREEGWQLQYRHDSFPDLLEMLMDGEIDVLPDMAFTESRAESVVFSQVNVIDDWLQVFAPEESRVVQASDLEGLTVALLDGSRQEELLRSGVRQLFGVTYDIATFDNYAATQKAVLDGEADVLVASRFFQFSSERSSRISATAILFSPSINLYGFRPGIDSAVPAAVDRHIAELQNTPESLYYRSVQRWIASPPEEWPTWIYLLAGLAVAVSVALLLVVPALRHRLRLSRQNYHEVFNATSEAIFIQDPETGQILDMNVAGRRMYRLGQSDQFDSLSAPGALEKGYDMARALENIRTAKEKGSHRFEWLARRSDGTDFWAEVSLRYAQIGGKQRILATVHDIDDRKEAELRLRRALEEKKVLLRELYHRTKNNLQVVSSLLNMQAASFSDPSLRHAFATAEDRIAAMAEVHQRLYAADDLAAIASKDYISELCFRIVNNSSSGRMGVRVLLDIDRASLTLDVAVPLGLVLNELVANSMQHAFGPDTTDGVISVEFKRHPQHENGLWLRYQDNGRGLSSAENEADGLGMELIKSLTSDQLQGFFEFSRRVDGSGFCFVAEFYPKA